jgi:plasmid stability protein
VIVLTAMSIRNLDERTVNLLRIRAARHGRSMEAEVRAILADAVRGPDDAPGMLDVLADRFAELGGVELDLPPRNAVPPAPEFT